MPKIRRKKLPSGSGKIIFLAVLLFAGAVIFFCRVSIKNYLEEKIRRSSLPQSYSFNEVKKISEENEKSGIANQFENIPIISNGEGEIEDFTDQPEDNTFGTEKLPAEFNLAVPFTPQAPFAVWDEIHEDACEEASVMMVDAFFTSREFTAQSAEDEINSVVDWELKVFGYWLDTTAEETGQILREKYGHKDVLVVYDIGIDDIKREVAKGRPVILPAAGQLLGNIYFQQPGPLYHMLVVRGWTKEGMIITNDPGTKRGEGYLYEPEVLINAVHDWNGGDVENGRKVMIVVEK